MSIIAVKKVHSKEVHISFADGELTAKTQRLTHIKTVDHGDKHGLPLDLEYHFALDGERTLIIHMTEHIYSEMRKVAAIQRAKDRISRNDKPKSVMVREKRKRPSWWHIGRRGGRGRGHRLGSRTPQMIDISNFTSKAIMARMGLKNIEDDEEAQDVQT